MITAARQEYVGTQKREIPLENLCHLECHFSFPYFDHVLADFEMTIIPGYPFAADVSGIDGDSDPLKWAGRVLWLIWQLCCSAPESGGGARN